MECFQINLANATLYYQNEAGGFSSIVDNDGNDWLAYKKDSIQSYPANAASEFRGLPNLVFRSKDNGAGHPGFDKCISERIGSNQIRTTSKSGKWQWTWTFHPGYAELSVDNVDPEHGYWFLYEGVPGGKYRPQQQYWGNDKSGPNWSIPDYFFGNAVSGKWQWLYFGDDSVNRVFYILQVKADEISDIFSYLGNTEEGVISPDGMVVSGFGRDDGAKPMLNETGLRFVFGFREEKIVTQIDHRRFGRAMEDLISKIN